MSSRVGARLRAVVLAAGLTAGTLVTTVATETATATSAHAAMPSYASRQSSVMQVAAAQKGKPYRYGAAGPYAFDCSGLVQYVFKHSTGRTLPRTAASQYRYSHHITRSQLRVGDLVFVRSGSSITHVGIYAGSGYWWVAPHSGTRVQKQRIYSATHVYGRILINS